MATTLSQKQVISRVDFDKLLTAFVALDRAVVELYMQLHGMASDQQLAIRRQNRALHGLVRKRAPELLFGSAAPARWSTISVKR